MTYGVKQIGGILSVIRSGKPWQYAFFDYSGWPYAARKLWDYAIQCHYGHLLDFSAALIFYVFLWPLTFPHAAKLDFSIGGWISIVVAYNLACEWILFSFWHWMTYSSSSLASALKGYKYNPVNQYEGEEGRATLRREQFYTTLGWLQSSAYQCVIMWLYATGRVPYHEDLWGQGVEDKPEMGWYANPRTLHVAGSIGGILLMTYWREFHFYWVHRMIHPWGTTSIPDVGQFLYTYAHSLHHKSHNPGPWAGLSMHPLEHLLYYTCVLLPLAWRAHPLAFLYAKFHADIAPIGGHDGYANPGGDGALHWLHHHKYECNYGVPLIDFDTLFGTYLSYEDWKASGGKSVKAGMEYAKAKAKAGKEPRHAAGASKLE